MIQSCTLTILVILSLIRLHSSENFWYKGFRGTLFMFYFILLFFFRLFVPFTFAFIYLHFLQFILLFFPAQAYVLFISFVRLFVLPVFRSISLSLFRYFALSYFFSFSKLSWMQLMLPSGSLLMKLGTKQNWYLTSRLTEAAKESRRICLQ